MAFEDLLRALTARADGEIAALLASAREQAQVIRREADQRRAERSATALRDRARAVTVDTERGVAEAVRLERHNELAARIRARDHVLSSARVMLADADLRPDYQAAVSGRLAAAAAVLGDAPARLRCAPALAPVLNPLAVTYSNLRLETDASVAGGFVIESDDGRVIVDEVLEHRLAGDAEALGQLALRSLEVEP